MKIKDLLEFNPEAKIEVIMSNGLPFTGNLDYGWSNGSGDIEDTRKETATEVCILLGDAEKIVSVFN